MPVRDSFFNDEDPGPCGNRQSAAARSKARMIRALERRVEALRDDANALLSYLALLQSDNSGLAAGNRELRSRLQAMEQQNRLNVALNEELIKDIQLLKVASGQNLVSNSKPEQPSAAAAGGHEDLASCTAGMKP